MEKGMEMEAQIDAVQRMQDYIDSHLFERITPADLARAALYSPWYAARLFTRWVSLSPAEYIRRLRLSRSALRLRDARATILEVALDVGFQSVDGYQRAFFREFGCNPGEYAENPVPIHLFTPYGVKSKTIRREKAMEDVKTVFVQVIEKPERRALIKRGVKADDYWSYCHEVGCDVWGLLVSMPGAIGEPVCLWLPEKHIKPGTSKYVQGVEVALDYDGVIPEGFDVIDLPRAKYLMFKGEPFAEEDFEAAIGQVWDAMGKYDPAIIGYAWDDENPRIQLEPRGERGYVELRAIR